MIYMRTFILILSFLTFSSCHLPAWAEEKKFSLDDWTDAIYMAEGGKQAVMPYGMFYDGCSWATPDYCRKIVKNTVHNTLVKYRVQRCQEGESDIDCLARRYCPLDDPRDTKGVNKHWKKNVLFYLHKEN